MRDRSENFFGENLRKLRRFHRETQRQVADAMNLTRACIANYERASRMPSVPLLKKFSRHFHVSIDKLLSSELDFSEPDQADSDTLPFHASNRPPTSNGPSS